MYKSDIMDVNSTAIRHSENIDCVKTEPEEEVCDYEGTNQAERFESVFVKMENSIEENNEAMIDALGDEENTIRAEEVKEPRELKILFEGDFSEDKSVIGDNFYCNECSVDYKGFCSKCSILTHILNNDIPPMNSEWKLKTISSEILEIRDTSGEKRVFALRNLPENVILGPFDGVSPIERSGKFMWGIKDGKLATLQNGNWMQYINCAASASTNNLDVFQFEGNLYYQTNTEISESEELLVYYREKEIQKSNNEDICFFPTSVKESQKVFACTLCCLGFQLEEGLIRHKQKCPHLAHNRNISEIIQCYYCNIWLENKDYQEHHVPFCQKNHVRLCKYPAVIDRSKAKASSTSAIQILKMHTGGVEELLKGTESTEHGIEIEKHHKCPQCSFRTHRKDNLRMHIKYKHSVGLEKRHKCAECSYETHNKTHLKMHILNRHSEGMEKRFKCTECSYETNHKGAYTNHVMNKHNVGMEKRYKCADCPYQTNDKTHLTTHIVTKHSVGMEKRHKCAECSYQTNHKSDLTLHIINKHTVGMEKRHKCTLCTFQTNKKSHLTDHIINKHSIELEKRYKCTECWYQTNIKSSLTRHMNKHTVETEKRDKCAECSSQGTEKCEKCS